MHLCYNEKEYSDGGTTMNTATYVNRICENLSRVVYGAETTKRLAVCAMLAGGHILIDDVPGTGKTELAKALAVSVGADFKRIQFTPDLLPSDVSGINYFNAKENDFVLRRGPIFANIVLADEINRATPRTQAALLESMEERQVTIDGETLPLPSPFLVIATMNPMEYQGTFPLPEAQIERFLMRLPMRYPELSDELRIVEKALGGTGVSDLSAVVTEEDRLAVLKEIEGVFLSEEVRSYIVRLVRATRESEKIRHGVSPRGIVALARAARVYAAAEGRAYVLPDDVKALAVPVLAHRLIPNAQSTLRITGSAEELVEYLLGKVPAPVV